MWDFVQVTVVVTLVLEIRFGILRASAGWICSVDYGVNSSPPSSRSKSNFWVGNLLDFCVIMTEHSRFSGSPRAFHSPPSWQARSCVNTWRPGLCPWALGARPWQGKKWVSFSLLQQSMPFGMFGLPSLSVELGHMTLFLDQREWPSWLGAGLSLLGAEPEIGLSHCSSPSRPSGRIFCTQAFGKDLGVGWDMAVGIFVGARSLAVWQGPLKGKFVRESGPGAMQSARLGSSLAFKGFGKDGGLSLYNPCVRQGKLRETPISFGLLILESMVRQGCQFLVREQSVCWGPWRQKLGLPRVELGSELILGRERLELGLA
ncbi:unnamed protein product [Prunus armeniaca]|uniref:Uncharacterized protein n=1 Tax=Prunus armeniaca TaxID=36596 RepID=A0A6J5UPY1_PRUAR|nr:unnamed protein product [Prunus armeniaca]